MITHTIPLDVATALYEMGDSGGTYSGYENVHDEQVDTLRWVSVHRLIIRRISDQSLWELPYEVGLTEYQEADLFYGDPVTVTLVRAEQVVTTRYLVVKETDR